MAITTSVEKKEHPSSMSGARMKSAEAKPIVATNFSNEIAVNVSDDNDDP